MRIQDYRILGDTVSSALSKAYHAGLREGRDISGQGGVSIVYDPTRPMNDLLQTLDHAGFKIVRKEAARPAEPLEIKLPDGSIHGYLHGGEVLKPGANIVLTPEGERIIQAVAAGDYSDISDRDVAAVFGTPAAYARRRQEDDERRAIKRGLTPEDFTGEAEPVKADEHKPYADAEQKRMAEAALAALDGSDQKSPSDLARRFDPSWCYRNDATYRARHDQAVRDCLEASRLTYAAAEVIGHAAVSEILNSAEPPAAGEAA